MEAIGTIGRYKIVREIARSNDVVYEAIDPAIGRRVAVKELVLPPNLTGAERRERIERFYREAKAAGSLSHPNIVTIYEVGESEGRYFIAMEYLDGHTLREELRMRGVLAVDRAVEIALQVLDALAYAHSNAVVHRDIKPENIHLLPNGHVKITDFGIARIMTEPSLTSDGRIFGTPSYMSPEQIAGRQVDERTDLFSLGVVLYEVLTGQKPFVGESIAAITYQITMVDPQPPDGVPEWLREVVMKALRKNPAERYQSAVEMAADLRAGISQAVPVGIGSAGGLQAPSVSAGVGGPTVQMDSSSALSVPTTEPSAAFRKSFLYALLVGILLGTFILLAAVAVRTAYANYVHALQQRRMQELFAQARTSFEAKQYELAAQQYAEIARAYAGTEVGRIAASNASVALVLAARVEAERGDANKALGLYTRAVQIDPKNVTAFKEMGDLYYRLGNTAAAARCWETVLSIAPGSAEALDARESLATLYYNLGVSRKNAGDQAGAVSFFEKAFRVSPESEAGIRAAQELQVYSAKPEWFSP
ncbi:MAG: protein kinase domain-containing protein [Armatimonadota bacterium]